ncbi:hypothetical protein NQ315_008300, partial [Exocentrus adspersus]
NHPSGPSTASDHSYSENVKNDNFDFLLHTDKTGLLNEMGLKKSELNPRENFMYKAHLLENKGNQLKNNIKSLYEQGKFQIIEGELNDVTKNFINSQLRNFNKIPHAKRWTVDDKVLALSLYKRSPRLYRYLSAIFQFPSCKSLKTVMSQIPFETGINSTIFSHLQQKINNMNEANRCCSLIFDEMSLSPGFYYDANNQLIYGYEDLGHLGRINKQANHALVFMIRGLRKTWKQVVAYYFTSGTISAQALKQIIVHLISELQNIGLKCVIKVNKPVGITSVMCRNIINTSSYYFSVNGVPLRVVTIYDVSHLLKNTRNSLLRCNLTFQKDKVAKFQYIESSFNLDHQKRTYRQLSKMNPSYFNFKDSYMKMKNLAACIETWVAFKDLPSEAAFTAEFCHLIDSLFDSLNSSNLYSDDGKKYRCALTEESPHVEFWSEILQQMRNWQLIDISSGQNVTNQYSFIKGWQTTIKSVISLWNQLKNIDSFTFLFLRNLNQDPVENLFGVIRQHGVCNNNPTSPNKLNSNCLDDSCTPLADIKTLLAYNDLRAQKYWRAVHIFTMEPLLAVLVFNLPPPNKPDYHDKC